MIAFVYKRKRAGRTSSKNGASKKRVAQDRCYRGRFRLDGESDFTDIALKTTDKQIAQQKLAEAVKERQNELAGNPMSKAARDAAKIPLVDHIEHFIRFQEGQRKSVCYIKQQRKQLTRVFADCGWKTLRDINPEGFDQWIASHKLTPSTLNNYLHTFSAFLKEMEKCRKITYNAARQVRKVKSNADPSFKRRALPLPEFQRLVASSGKRATVYLTAGLTGLRSNELKQLQVCDLHLDGEQPFVNARPSTTKNDKEAHLPLHADVVKALRDLIPSSAKPHDLVFKGLVPRAREFYRDLEAAGIPQQAPDGKVLHFHSLRYTFATMLVLAGVPHRVVMELMRHSDPKLTSKIYTDTGFLPTGESVRNLPSVLGGAKSGTLIGTLSTVSGSPNQSTPDHINGNGDAPASLDNTGKEAPSDPVCPSLSKVGKWCAMQGSNLRPLPCQGNALPLS